MTEFLKLLPNQIVVAEISGDNGAVSVNLEDTCMILPIETIMNRTQTTTTKVRGRQIKSNPPSSNVNESSRSKRNSTSSLEEIKMPEVHQGIAASSIPIPLNSIMKSWNNVPKLHQYQPAELQVLYHRRSGSVETVQPMPFKSSSNTSTIEDVSTTLTLPQETTLAAHFQHQYHPQPASLINARDSPISLSPSSSAMSQERNHKKINPSNGDLPVPIPNVSFADKSIQHAPHPLPLHSQSIQTQNCYTSTTESQTNMDSLSTECQTQTAIHIEASPKHRASQTEVEQDEKSTPVSHGHGVSQTDAISAESRICQTDNAILQHSETQVSISTADDFCQTLEELVAPCDSCPMIEAQSKQLEEQIQTLSNLLQSTEEDLIAAKKDLLLLKPESTTDSQQQTDDNGKSQEQLDDINRLKQNNSEQAENILHLENRLRQANIENAELKITVKKLGLQVGSFQNGLARLRLAIEKPVGDSQMPSDKAIEEVFRRADAAISSFSERQERVANLSNYLSGLNRSGTGDDFNEIDISYNASLNNGDRSNPDEH